jgi:hypothetical protein
VAKLLEPLPQDEQSLLKIDSILKALGVENGADVEKLLGYFLADADNQELIHPNDVRARACIALPSRACFALPPSPDRALPAARRPALPACSSALPCPALPGLAWFCLPCPTLLV